MHRFYRTPAKTPLVSMLIMESPGLDGIIAHSPPQSLLQPQSLARNILPCKTAAALCLARRSALVKCRAADLSRSRVGKPTKDLLRGYVCALILPNSGKSCAFGSMRLFSHHFSRKPEGHFSRMMLRAMPRSGAKAGPATAVNRAGAPSQEDNARPRSDRHYSFSMRLRTSTSSRSVGSSASSDSILRMACRTVV